MDESLLAPGVVADPRKGATLAPAVAAVLAYAAEMLDAGRRASIWKSRLRSEGRLFTILTAVRSSRNNKAHGR